MAEKSTDYKTGFQAGRQKTSTILQEEYNVMHLRAKRAESGAGIGCCRDCRYYQHEMPTAKWGTCAVSTGTVSFLGQPWRGEPKQRIIVQEGFGCIYHALPDVPRLGETP